MSWIATAVGVGTSLLTSRDNRKGAEAAANATPKFAEQVQPLVDQQVGRLTDQDVPVFGGDRVANLNPLQLKGIGQTKDLADALQTQAGTAAEGFTGFADGSKIGANPYLDSSIAAMRETALRDLSRNQLPAIQNTAVADGGVGGSRQGIAEGLAFSDMNRDLIAAESGMRQGQFNTDTAQQLDALKNQGQILSGQTAGSDLLLSRGGIAQQQQQNEMDARLARFNEENGGKADRDTELLRILMGAPSGTPPIPVQTNPLVAGLGGAVTADQLFNRAPVAAPTPTNYPTNTSGFNPSLRP